MYVQEVYGNCGLPTGLLGRVCAIERVARGTATHSAPRALFGVFRTPHERSYQELSEKNYGKIDIPDLFHNIAGDK